MSKREATGLTYREAWEIYIEPTLKEQREDDEKPVGMAETQKPIPQSAPQTKEQCKASAIAAGMMFGADPLEVAKAFEKSWPNVWPPKMPEKWKAL